MNEALDIAIATVIWIPVGLFLLLWLSTRLSGTAWLPAAEFKEKYPGKDWLTSISSLFPIVWVPLSVALTARYVQERSGFVFLVFTVFVTLMGIGIFKGLIEIVFGVSSRIVLAKMRSDKAPRLLSVETRSGLMLLQALEYRFAMDDKRIRRMGLLRVVINVVFLAGLVFFLP